MNKLDRIIQMIREQMVANAPGGSGGFGSDSNPKGPVAGRSPKMVFLRRKSGKIYPEGESKSP